MSAITIQRAALQDAEALTILKRETFNKEAERWLPEVGIEDYNIQPPGYDSLSMMKYMISHLHFFQILSDEKTVGGLAVTLSGKYRGRIDRIFVIPEEQGKGIGGKAIDLLEELYPQVISWDLETSSRQTANHHFYEKKGFVRVFETEDEFSYSKQKPVKDMQASEFEARDLEGSSFYSVNLQNSDVSNSNVSSVHFSNSNMTNSKFQNINFRNTLFADLNLSNSKFAFVTMGGMSFEHSELGESGPVTFTACNMQGSRFLSCNMKDVEIKTDQLSGMTLNGVLVEKMLSAYLSQKES
ncbi:GNAT family N-acetyltransferase [Bacillus lacus]|uniref:GNAT family N-acetyltransferase n=1 Tax=Metabacillus lacus TaxID=1983721 RepID=A0A7X2M184_9BACI|nr:GNAT family N-acetyltransferase [Metabacillus lacus]MRX74392.1 GNAT family N-acetyltransferase [Metabacillus lacus]